MEPGDLVQGYEAKGLHVDTLVMDDDATTILRIKQKLQWDINKHNDLNHLEKHVGGSLWALAKKHKVLSSGVISWLQTKCFMYAVTQNKGNPEKLREDLKAIVPHAFGEHNKCGDWCGYKKDPVSFEHSSLPKGQNFTGATLRSDLEKIFDTLSENAANIAPYASTNCTVAQENVGHGYVSKFNESLGVAPRTLTKQTANTYDKKRQTETDHTYSKRYKRQHLPDTLQDDSHLKSVELHEGPTYSTGIAVNTAVGIENIPPPKESPTPELIASVPQNRVYFDLETTSLAQNCDIVQLSAVCGANVFDTYVQPSQPIAKEAAAVHGITCQSGQMAHLGKPVQSLPPNIALQNFMHWLEDRKPVILIAHNGKRFDAPRILRHICCAKLRGAFSNCVLGFADTLPVFQELCPKMPNYKQETLVSQILNTQYQAHNSLEDVKALQELCMYKSIEDQLFQKHSVTTSSLLEILEDDKMTEGNLVSMDMVIRDKVVNAATAKKIAQSGLSWGHVEKAYQRDNDNGVANLFKEKHKSGKVRVTARKKIISSVVAHLKSK